METRASYTSLAGRKTRVPPQDLDHYAWRRKNVPIFRSCSPKIRNDDTDHFDGSCALILEVLGSSDKWNGRMHMSESDKEDLLLMIEQHAGEKGTGDTDGKLSLDELLAFSADNSTRHALLHDYPMSIACLASEDLVKETFAHRDADKSGFMEKEEWSMFLNDLHKLHLTYLLVDAFRQFRAFFGRGRTYVNNLSEVPPNLSSSEADIESLRRVLEITDKSPDQATQEEENMKRKRSITEEYQYRSMKLSRFQVGLDREFCDCWPDFWYYSANYHPLHGIFSGAPDSILSWRMRLALELVTIAFSYFTYWLAEYNDRSALLNVFDKDPDHVGNIIFFNTIVVTLPGMALWWILFLLFNCPKLGVVDEALSSKEKVEQARCCRCTGIIIAWLVLVFVVVGVLGVSLWKDLGWKKDTISVVRGRAKGYLVSWFLQTFVYFNPLVAWGEVGETPTVFGTIGDLIGLGQWRIERQKFKLRCAKQLQAWEERQNNEIELRKKGMWRRPRKAPAWKVQQPEGDGFQEYGKADCEFLERQWRNWKEFQEDEEHALVKGFNVTVNGKTGNYTIDFKTMTQVSDYGKSNEQRVKIDRVMPLL